MVVYADIFFIVNLYIDYFILLLVKKVLHLNTGNFQIFIGSLIGALFSLSALLNLPNYINYLLAIIFSALIVFVTFRKNSYYQIIKCYALFLTISFSFSGIILVFSQITSKTALIGGKPYFQISPVMLLLFTALSYFISQLLDKIRGKCEDYSNFCKIVVEQNGESLELFAKVDTGNNLKEPFSGLPVIVAEKEEIAKVTSSKETYRLIPYSSLGGSGLLPAFLPNKTYIKKSNKEFKCYLAVYDGKLSAGSYNCLISQELF